MPYTTVAKVQSMFRKIKIEADTSDEDTNTVITIEEVDEWISAADAIIDSKLFPFYTVPITGVESLKIVEEISRLMVAHRIKGVMELEIASSDEVQAVQGNLMLQAKALLKSLIPQFNKAAKRYEQALCILTDTVAKAFSPENEAIFSTHTPVDSTKNRRVIIKGGSNGLGGNNW